jgi:hypothetical protein
MKVKAIIRLMVLCSMMAIVMVVVARPAAADEELSMRWDLKADLTGEKPDVILIVEVGVYDEEGNWHQTDQTENRLKCGSNNVVWTGKDEPAIFDGSAYIECEMLNVLGIATEMTGGEVEFAEQSGGSGTIIDADVSLTNPYNDNSIFYHPDLQFSAYTQGEALLKMEVGGLSAESDIFMPDVRDYLHGEFQATDDAKVHLPAFAVNANPLDATPQVLTGSATVSHMYEGSIFIGYSPATNTYFEGGIYTIDVDPGCIGMG